MQLPPAAKARRGARNLERVVTAEELELEALLEEEGLRFWRGLAVALVLELVLGGGLVLLIIRAA